MDEHMGSLIVGQGPRIFLLRAGPNAIGQQRNITLPTVVIARSPGPKQLPIAEIAFSPWTALLAMTG